MFKKSGERRVRIEKLMQRVNLFSGCNTQIQVETS